MATHNDMGPAAFMWPPDRVWSAAADNHAPCGSVASVGNRTNFPLSGGQIALVTQDDAWDLELSVAHVDDPQSNDDFEQLIDVLAFRDLDLGHTCVTVDDSHPNLQVGDKATLQIKYISEFDTPRNQTFYACADIVYVDDIPYDMSARCFNATQPDTGDSDSKDSDNKSGSDHKDEDADKDESDSEESNSSSSGGGKSGLSGGAIAGIVVGAVAGVVALAAAAILFNRKRQQKLRAERQRERESERNIQKYGNEDARTNSTSSVRMQNL